MAMSWQDFKIIRLNGIEYRADDLSSMLAENNFEGWSAWQQKIFLFLQDWWRESEYIAQKTSGSTGAAKNIRLEKNSMLASAMRTCSYFQLSEKSSAVLCLSADYIAGKMMIVRAIVSGMDLFTVKPDGKPYHELEGEVDFIAMVPLQAENMFDSIEQDGLRAAVKTVLLGGAQVSAGLEKKIANQHETDFYIGYGMTETCSHVALRKLGQDDDFYNSMEGVKIDLDERGCIVINDPVVVNQTLFTNDLAELDSECESRFRWLGRYDNVINSAGVKFSPEELEKTISHLMEKPFIISSIPDERFGEKIILIVEAGFSETRLLKGKEREELIAQLKVYLPKFAAPKEVLFVPELAKTENGKVDRLARYKME